MGGRDGKERVMIAALVVLLLVQVLFVVRMFIGG